MLPIRKGMISAVIISFACALQINEAQADTKLLTKAGNQEAILILEQLPIKGRAAKTGYTRKQFGNAWSDVDRNGCDNRNDVLNRDFTNTHYKPGTRSCKVVGGDWIDPYTGDTYHFDHQPSEVSIDHVVALSDAWQKGAQLISATKRKQFANDPLNLIPTSKRVNSQKSDSDAASWLPPRKTFRCHYVARQIAVKQKYSLWVTQSEHDAMKRVLALPQCSGTLLPAGQTRVS